MAGATTASQIFENHNISSSSNTDHEISKQEIQAAIAKVVELRALHAALMQGNSLTNVRFPSPFPASLPGTQFSAKDYPVFTPTSYEEETLSGYQEIQLEEGTLSESWDEYGLERNDNETFLSDYKENSSSRKVLPFGLASLESHICPTEDYNSVTGSCANHTALLQTSPGNDYFKLSRRNGMGYFESVSTCNRCKPAIITTESKNATRKSKNSNTVFPLKSQPKNRGRGVIAWLFPRLQKKHKNKNSSNRIESEEVSRIFKDQGIVSIDILKKELIEANENGDAALMEVAEMKSSMVELKQKLEYLETYCEELKEALRQATQAKDSQVPEKVEIFGNRGKSLDGNGENSMSVSKEVMEEGFLQMVLEARLSVRQFCKTLVGQIEETDHSLINNLNMLLQPYELSLNSIYSESVSYHLEAFINQAFYQDFENCVYQKNGTPKFLDPKQDRQKQFSSFVALKNLSWNEVLRKGTKYYSEEFSKFCDQKMSCIVATLNWTRPWPEQLLQAFFVAAKCIWLLHLLAFSFNPPLGILRVEENKSFDPYYMEDMFTERQRSHSPSSSRVKIMVMPGFYVQERILRCKVLCGYC
ncbi:hypothetical protein I3842_14G125700 [Carya illinoinensis]|uniref:IRK-interacting protein n=1 Tax=Carya illinoinensis TaxID=32201 RepID=A0A922D9N6_CARIL|nr:hypothetical protein I3842_14G125700 [Carya illinoinensis]